MKYLPTFKWDEETGVATCILTDGQHYFTGIACCHDDDEDMCSQKVGEEIACRRARIDYLKFYRDTLKSELRGLRQFYYAISQSNKFNKESYEVKMLFRHINRLEFDLNYAREIIEEERKSLNQYINNKEKFYQKIRQVRNKEVPLKNSADLEEHIQVLENIKEGKDIENI